MSTTEESWRTAWEPLTPRGVAAFAGATLCRLLLAQLLMAMLAAGSVAWFLERAWFPVARDAIRHMPDEGIITNGYLSWTGETPLQLSENRFLGLAVDLFHSGQLGRAAHLQVEFGREDFRVYSLLGYRVFAYPPGWSAPFNRAELDPWWGAWEPWLLVTEIMAVVASLMVSWVALATIYCVPVRLISFFENRSLNWAQSWRLGGAVCMPGALFLTAGIVAYGFGWMDLIRLGGMFGLHFIVGWIYLFITPYFCPRKTAANKVGENPFAKPVEEKKQP